jgi:hypothetical protein
MKWEQSRKTTKLGSTTVTEIEWTPEAKERMSLKREWRKYDPPDYDRMPLFDRIVWSVVGLIAGVAIVTIGYIAWAHVFGGA